MATQKRWDDDWRKTLLMTWLCTPPKDRNPASKSSLAAMFGVDLRTINLWINEPSFRNEWARRAGKVIGSEDRAKEVLDTLYAVASDASHRNQVQAAKLFLEATNAIRPQPMEVTVRKPSELSDDELDALLAQGARSLADERAKGAEPGTAT